MMMFRRGLIMYIMTTVCMATQMDPIARTCALCLCACVFLRRPIAVLMSATCMNLACIVVLDHTTPMAPWQFPLLVLGCQFAIDMADVFRVTPVSSFTRGDVISV